MNQTETKKIVASIVVSFPNYKPVDMELMVRVWTEALKDYTYDEVSTGLIAYIRTNTSGFAPSTGQIIDKIHSTTRPLPLNESEAWALVRKAINNGTYNSAQEYAKLPPAVQKAVGTHEQLRNWAMDEDFSEEVAKSNFERAYRIEANRKLEYQKMPQAIQENMDMVSKRSERGKLELERQRAGNPSLEDNKSRQTANTDAREVREDDPTPLKPEERINGLKERWDYEEIN